jgi:hypothetical protein
MIRILRALAGRLRRRPRDPEDLRDSGYRKPVDNADARAAGSLHHHHHDQSPGVSGYPPGYVKGYDERRPRK